jgi:hypothetical protein
MKKPKRVRLRNNFSHRFVNKVEVSKKTYTRKNKHKGNVERD